VNIVYVIYSESVFNDQVAVEVVGSAFYKSYNAALSELSEIASDLDVILDEDESSFTSREGGSTVEYYIDTLSEG